MHRFRFSLASAIWGTALVAVVAATLRLVVEDASSRLHGEWGVFVGALLAGSIVGAFIGSLAGIGHPRPAVGALEGILSGALFGTVGVAMLFSPDSLLGVLAGGAVLLLLAYVLRRCSRGDKVP